MRILVLSDVHGNLPALKAVLAEPHDLVLCLGDLVGFGPDPGPCVQWIRKVAHTTVQGDYDRAVADGLPWPLGGPLNRLGRATAAFTLRHLGASDREYLRALPRWAITTASGERCLLVHGTPADALDGALAQEPHDWRPALAGVRTGMILVDQAHRQFEIGAGATRVVSPGSVGLPLDGDPRAAYAILDDGAVELRRKEYPVATTIDRLGRRGLPGSVLRALQRVLRTGSPPPDRSPPAGDPSATLAGAGQGGH